MIRPQTPTRKGYPPALTVVSSLLPKRPLTPSTHQVTALNSAGVEGVDIEEGPTFAESTRSVTGADYRRLL